MPAKVLFPLADGFEEIEAVTIVDVLRRGGVEVTVASLSDALAVKGAHAMTFTADVPFEAVAANEYDAIVLPGGACGTDNLKHSTALLQRLRRQRDEKKLLAAICAAPTVLVAAGVLEADTQITCYPTCQRELDRPWSPAPVVEDGNFITGQAPGSAMLFSLVVLKALVGDAGAASVARGLVTRDFG